MWLKILVLLVSVLCFGGCKTINQNNENDVGFFGYELLQHQLEVLQLRVSELVTTFNKTDEKINKLSANGRLLDLISSSSKLQKATDEKISDLAATMKEYDLRLRGQIGTLVEEIGRNRILMELKESRLLERLTKLESLGESIARGQKTTDNRIVDITGGVSALQEQSKQILRNHFDLVLPSCSMAKVAGVYRLQVPSVDVLCEPTMYGGGWLVIQLRFNGDMSFDRGWYDYRTGFGTVRPLSEFWLGLEAIHQITSSGQYELRVDVRNERKEHKYALYSQFNVAGQADGYRLTVGGHSGTASDELAAHNNRKFSTFDSDNDTSDRNCAKEYQSGWWYDHCRTSNLNGPYNKGDLGYGIEWGSFADAGTYSRMMIRRKQ